MVKSSVLGGKNTFCSVSELFLRLERLLVVSQNYFFHKIYTYIF